MRSLLVNIHLFIFHQSEHIYRTVTLWLLVDFLTFLGADGVVLIDPEYLKERKGETSANRWLNILTDFMCEQNQNI